VPNHDGFNTGPASGRRIWFQLGVLLATIGIGVQIFILLADPK